MKTINKCYLFFFKELKDIYNKYEIYKLFIILFTFILNSNINKLYLYILNNTKINYTYYCFFIYALYRLKNKYPIQYIIKLTIFNDIKIYLNNKIFIPRQETEELVNYIIKDNIKSTSKKLKILDLCTGSGCISISIRNYFYNSSSYCLDYSKEILLKAKKNFILNKINNKIYFYKFNLLNKKKRYNLFFKKIPKFDIIISNPPYISYKDYNKYINTNIFYEPYKSIFVLNNDVLIFYKKIILNFYKKKLKKKGIIYFEISNNIKKKIDIFLKHKLKNTSMKFIKDINNNYRILKIITK